MADATAATSPAPAAEQKTTVKPDEDEFKAKLSQAEKAHGEAMKKLDAVKAKIDVAQPNRNKENASPTQKRRQELISQLNEIRQKQGEGKKSRGDQMQKVKNLEDQVRSRIAEQKTMRGKMPFKNAEELDSKVKQLTGQVDSGTMKLVDEKKALAEISNLKKQRKTFSQADDSQKKIDELRAQIKTIKDAMDDPEAKAMSEQYSKLQKELDEIKAEQDEAYKNLNALRDERTKLQAQQQETFKEVRRIKDEFYNSKRQYNAMLQKKKEERARVERERREKRDLEFKKERAEKMLAEARDPAYLDEIRRANSLMHFFDPSHAPEAKTPLLADKGLGAQAQRKVDDAGLKGTRLVRKEDREDEYLAPVKKGKKGKKTGGPPAASGNKYSCPPSVVEDCAFMGIDPPMSSEDIPAAVEKIKAKLDGWKADQEAQTQRNIDKAKKEIAKLEASEANGETEEGSNGTKEDQDVADATSGVKNASIEDKAEVTA